MNPLEFLLDLIVPVAHAQTAAAPAAAPGGMMSSLLFPVILIAIMYFLMIRPQMKRAKEQKAMLGALKKGDEVITAGGVVGRITKVTDAYITLEVARAADGRNGEQPVEMHFQKASVQTLLPNGTIKSI